MVTKYQPEKLLLFINTNTLANLGIEVIHERNAHNFPLDLAVGEAVPVAMMSTTVTH